LESIFVEINAELVPFFIDKIRATQKNQFLVKLQDVNTPEETMEILSSNIYIPLSLLPKSDDNDSSSNEIIGFNVIDKKYGNIGIVEEIITHTHQDILQIKYNRFYRLIPCHFILSLAILK
jgi:16S rRNA processing protein RimM